VSEYVPEHILKPEHLRAKERFMPYPKDHKARSRKRIIESARELFNRHGYDRVSISMVMERASLTHGGFYSHFANKEELFAVAVDSFLMGRGKEWRDWGGIDPTEVSPIMARRMVEAYLSREHLTDLEGQCPMIALSTDVARAGPEVRAAYERLLIAMVSLFAGNLGGRRTRRRERALAMAAMCVGGMILSRTIPGSAIADEVREAALKAARSMVAQAA
jgi:TetR/AcrR family transcriptional regulator, transcriptional repressor for nem operon